MLARPRYSRAIPGSAQGSSVTAIAATSGDIGSIQRLEDIGGTLLRAWSKPLVRLSPLGCSRSAMRVQYARPVTAWTHEGLSPRFSRISRGDRRGSNPRPSGPQSAEVCCSGLRGFANSLYVRHFLFPGLPGIAGHCVRGGVRVVSTGRRQPSQDPRAR
jgi:hypothetical protein